MAEPSAAANLLYSKRRMSDQDGSRLSECLPLIAVTNGDHRPAAMRGSATVRLQWMA